MSCDHLFSAEMKIEYSVIDQVYLKHLKKWRPTNSKFSTEFTLEASLTPKNANSRWGFN